MLKNMLKKDGFTMTLLKNIKKAPSIITVYNVNITNK